MPFRVYAGQKPEMPHSLAVPVVTAVRSYSPTVSLAGYVAPRIRARRMGASEGKPGTTAAPAVGKGTMAPARPIVGMLLEGARDSRGGSVADRSNGADL
jgi:hypothetical protein